MDDLLADFIEETREMLEASESEIIAWEANPSDRTRLDAIFRFVHTVKGNCGFFDFPRLERLSHAAEDALADVRKGRREPDAALVTTILKTIDRITDIVNTIDNGSEVSGDDSDLIAALEADSGEAHQSAVVTDPNASNDTTEQQASSAQRTIRLPVELLDRVMSGVSDMVLARNDLAHRLREAGDQPTVDGPFERMTSILSDVRDAVTRMRMQRIEHLFSAFPRLVRDLSAELQKQVMVDIDGGDVELDREMIEMIRDPMVHIIRNAIDHGIERPADRLKAGKREIGIVTISARQSGNTIAIEVSDDGGGLDEERICAKAIANEIVSSSDVGKMSRAEKLQLIFAAGLSTADTVSAISGRGVGMDVVRENIEKVGGSIAVSSTPGKGSVFTLQIPLTLSIIAGLTVDASGQRFAIPQSYVEEIVHGSASDLDISKLGNATLVTFRGERTPCLSLSKVLELDEPEIDSSQVFVFLKQPRTGTFALAVDEIHNHGDLVVKPLAPSIMRSRMFAGSTLLDNGQPILLLDIPSIMDQAGLQATSRSANDISSDQVKSVDLEDRPMAMVFTDFNQRRRAARLELVHRIETVPVTAIDRTGTHVHAVVDGEIIPVFGLEDGAESHEVIRMLRLSDGSAELLYATAKIEDTVEISGEPKRVDDDSLVEGITLVHGEQIALIDGHALFARYGSVPKRAAALSCRLPDNEWAQTILAPLVRAAGYEPLSDTSESADVTVLVDQDQVANSTGEVIHLRSLPDDLVSDEELRRSIYRYDRDAVIRALRNAGKGEAA